MSKVDKICRSIHSNNLTFLRDISDRREVGRTLLKKKEKNSETAIVDYRKKLVKIEQHWKKERGKIIR